MQFAASAATANIKGGNILVFILFVKTKLGDLIFWLFYLGSNDPPPR